MLKLESVVKPGIPFHASNKFINHKPMQHIIPDFPLTEKIGAVIIAIIWISLTSLIPEPHRQKISALTIAGAGAAYLSGGLGGWEFAFCTLMSFVAFRGLDSYTFIGIGWLLHTCWDIMHHLYGNPIVPFDPASSAGCAVCDSILAIYFFLGAPNIFPSLRGPQKSIS